MKIWQRKYTYVGVINMYNPTLRLC